MHLFVQLTVTYLERDSLMLVVSCDLLLYDMSKIAKTFSYCFFKTIKICFGALSIWFCNFLSIFYLCIQNSIDSTALNRSYNGAFVSKYQIPFTQAEASYFYKDYFLPEDTIHIFMELEGQIRHIWCGDQQIKCIYITFSTSYQARNIMRSKAIAFQSSFGIRSFISLMLQSSK